MEIIKTFEGPIKQSIQSVFDGLNTTVEALDLLNKYYNSHIKSLKSEVEQIKLFGMNQASLLNDLYTPAYVSTTIKRRLFTDEWVKKDRSSIESSRAKDIIPGMNFIDKNKSIAILGGPGAGKTTFLKYIALAYADKSIFSKNKLSKELIPFFIPLPALEKTQKNIFNYISDSLVEKTTRHAKFFLDRIFKTGKAIFLLDSLDEVNQSKRNDVIEEINKFRHKYPEVKIVLSCRTADYGNTNISYFNEVEVARLNKSSISKIIDAFFINEKDKGEQLKNIINNDKSIDSLTETPLLLSLLCVQFKHDLSLPRRKVELFERCTQALLREWDTIRRFRRETAYQNLTDQAKERLFCEVAYYFSRENLTFIFPKTATIQVVSDFCSRISLEPSDAIGILNEIDCHHGILEKFSQEHYTFSHTSFQDFFAAKSIVARGDGLKETSINIDNQEWHSIIEFIVALEQDASAIINFLISKSSLKGLTNYPPMAKRTNWLRLLYRCLSTNPYLAPNNRENAITHIVESQFEIARIYTEGGVYPMSQLLKDGIHHPYLYVNKRPSLSTALQPFKQFSNEILKTHVPGYPEKVLELLPNIKNKNTQEVFQDALLLNLITPLVKQQHEKVKEIFLQRIENDKISFVSQIISSTLRNMDFYKNKETI